MLAEKEDEMGNMNDDCRGKRIDGLMHALILVAATSAAWMLVIVSARMFRQGDERPESGRYAIGQGNFVLDTADGTLYYFDDGKDDMTVYEVHLPSGLTWRRRHAIRDLGEKEKPRP